jgi:hypothetical protein
MALRFMAMEDQIKPAPSVDEKRVLPESVEGTAPKVAVEISDTLIEDYAIAKGIDPKSENIWSWPEHRLVKKN